MVFEETSLTYDELDAHSSQLAHHLRALGVGPEVVVGLCVERSLEMLVGLLGILKAGGAYLPLDPDYPPERLAFMLADAGAPVLVTQSALLDRLPLHNARIVQLDADWPAIATRPASAPAAFLHPQHPAYVIYTSGSTGTPKGVVVTHAGILESRRSADTSASPIASGSPRPAVRFARASMPRSRKLASALLHRVQPRCCRRTDRSGDALAKLIRAHEVTHATLPPVLLARFAGGPAAADLDRRRRGLLRRTWWRAGRKAGG